MNFQINTIGSFSKIILIIITMAFSQQAAALFSDNFTGGHNAGWRFYDPYSGNEEGESTLIYDGTNALIDIPNGLQHDLYIPVGNIDHNKAPRLLQAVSDPDANFEFDVKFETKPNVGIQMQGIIIQQTNNVFLRFDVYSTGGETKLFAAYINSSTGDVLNRVDSDLPKGSPNFRRVVRSGDDWKFLYSYNGTDWVVAADINQPLAVTDVGFYAATAGGNPKFLSSIDYFSDLSAPVTDNDTWTPPATEDVDPPKITIWNGFTLNNDGTYAGQFGQLGIQQKWANILGHVSSGTDLSSLKYTLNGGAEKSLRFNAKQRLEKAGDFNIEIDHASLIAGLNTVEIKAKDSNNQASRQIVTISHSKNNTWPLPYTANWSSLNSIQEVASMAHIVDGLWELTTDGGIRTTETGYDRAIAIGDMTWPTEDYEVTVPFTLHSDFAGIGFAVGWQGHEGGDSSPLIGWPLQALAWIRGSNSKAELDIVTYGGLVDWEISNSVKKIAPLIMNERYILKSFSKPLGNGMSKFHVKFWKASNQEPSNWDLKYDVLTRNGSVLLVAYKADVTFGNVSIDMATSTDSPTDTTAPVISNIQAVITDSTATITWETDKLSNSVVHYGATSNYGMNENNESQTLGHSITLSELNSNVDYHFKVQSGNGSTTSNSKDQTFFISASTYDLPHNEWHLISLPMDPVTKNKVSDVFGKEMLGNYGTSWAVFHYDANNKDYVDLGLNGEMKQGMGYWIIQMTSTTKTLGMPAGSLSTQVDVSGKFEIPLVTKEGSSQFNMIGYPFNTKGHFKDTRIETNEAPCDSDSGCTKDIAYAKENNILHNELWTYSGGNGYIKINTTNGNLDPWQGFWAETLSGANGKEPSLLFSKPENSNN